MLSMYRGEMSHHDQFSRWNFSFFQEFFPTLGNIVCLPVVLQWTRRNVGLPSVRHRPLEGASPRAEAGNSRCLAYGAILTIKNYVLGQKIRGFSLGDYEHLPSAAIIRFFNRYCPALWDEASRPRQCEKNK